MTRTSTIDRTVSVDKLVEWFERTGVHVDMEKAAEAVSAEEARERAEERAQRDALLAEIRTAEAIAQATPCGFEGCTGEGHDPEAESSEWRHYREYEFGSVELSISISTAEASIYARTDETLTAAELRTMADQYESFPAWLRARADELDALNG